jgi:hypothetical protein
MINFPVALRGRSSGWMSFPVVFRLDRETAAVHRPEVPAVVLGFETVHYVERRVSGAAASGSRASPTFR